MDTLFLFLVRFCGHLTFALSTFVDTLLCRVHFCGRLLLLCPLLWTPYFWCLSTFADACFCCLSAFVDTLLLPCPLLQTLAFAVSAFADTLFCSVHFCGHPAFALSTFVDTCFYFLSAFMDACFCFLSAFVDTLLCCVHFCGHPVFSSSVAPSMQYPRFFLLFPSPSSSFGFPVDIIRALSQV